MKAFFQEHKFGLKWIGIAFIIKLLLFIFFASCFHFYWPAKFHLNFLFNSSGDTSLYYWALESFSQGQGYPTNCRMPGLLPVYYPIRLLFDETITKSIIIILQFITSTVSVYFLAKTAKLIFNSQRIFLITFFIYAFSSFVSIWDHIGYMDSFGTSLLIFSIYLLVAQKQKTSLKLVILSGVLIAWSVFFRPINGVFVPVMIFIFLFDIKKLANSLKYSFVFSIPLVLALSLWTSTNYKKFHKIIVLQGDPSECFGGIDPTLLGIRDLIVAWGGDTQPWAKDSEGEWFFNSKLKNKKPTPASHDIYSASYNLDSLVELRNQYQITRNDALPDSVKLLAANKAIGAAMRYTESYKKEHLFSYFITNKFRLLKKFLLPVRLSDLPFPSVDKMNFVQKAVKVGYYLLLLIINILGLIGSFLLLRRKILLPLLPLAMIFVLCPLMGLIEQRYLVPVYIFFVMFTAYVIDKFYVRFKRK